MAGRGLVAKWLLVAVLVVFTLERFGLFQDVIRRLLEVGNGGFLTVGFGLGVVAALMVINILNDGRLL